MKDFIITSLQTWEVLLNSKGEAVGITSGGIDDSGANLNYAWNIQLIKSYIP